MVILKRTDLSRAMRALAVLGTLLTGFTEPAGAEAVAIITDLAGKVSVQGGAAKRDVTILSDIDADTRMLLDSGARLVVLYTGSGDEYALSGPAVIQFKAKAPAALSGAKPEKRANSFVRSADIRIDPSKNTQAAFVMRSSRPTARIKLLNLSGTKILESSPEFRWRGVEPGIRYQFELTDDTGKLLFETQVEGAALKLPPAIQLKEGIGYTWAVSSHLGDGRRYVNSGDFSIASADLRARVEALRPSSAAPVSERVVYAAWLDQMELKDEARRYWRALATERPEDTRLKALAAE